MMRIINSSGLVLELLPDAVISVEKVNPLFNDADKFFQDLSYPGLAPFTDNNLAFFGLAHLVEASNREYIFPIQLQADEALLVTGNIRAAVREKGFEFNLEPNLTAVNDRIKNVYLPQVRTYDANYTPLGRASFEALMLDTVKHPEKYPYIFLPVHNPHTTSPGTPPPVFQFMNAYSTELNKFDFGEPSAGEFRGSNPPFWKLTHLLTEIGSYLGFTPVGSILQSDAYNSLYVYTRLCFPLFQVIPSMRYLSYLKIADFLKQIRQRLHLAFDFNLSTGELTIESFRTILESSDPYDLTLFIGNVIEQELPEQKGYTVSLKSDQSDALFIVDSGEETTYPPLFTLVAGDGATPEELECSTLHGKTDDAGRKYCLTDQEAYNIKWDSEYFSTASPELSVKNNSWPVRLIRFLGYNQHGTTSGGAPAYWPDSEPVDLSADDVLYYRFLNDSKRLIIDAHFPPAILAGLSTTRKCTFRTPGYNYCEIIIEKITYDAGVDTELVSARIYARTLNFDPLTNVVINPVDKSTEAEAVSGITAYFDPKLHGITVVELEVISTMTTSDRGIYTASPVTNPTNDRGIGGAPSVIKRIGGRREGTPVEIRVCSGKPKFIEFLGKRAYFTAANGYYTVIAPMVNAVPDNLWISY